MVKEEESAYEIMPYKEIVGLKKEIAALKSKSGASSQDLLNSMNALTKNMDKMLQLFTAAAEEMKLEEKSESGLSDKIEPLMDKLDELSDQNKTIAEGMVAIADMVKEMKEKQGKKPTGKPKPMIKEQILPEYHPEQKPGLLPPINEPSEPELPPLPGEELPPLPESMPPPGPMPLGPIPPGAEPNIPAGPLAGGPMPPSGPIPGKKPKKKGLFRRR